MKAFNKYSNRVNDLLSTGRNKSYFVAAVTVFFILTMSFVGIIPAYSSLGLQIEENTKRDEAIQKLEKKLSDLKNLTHQNEDNSAVVKRFEYIFPEELQQQRTLNLLLDIADEANVNLAIIRYSESNSEATNRINLIVGNNIKVQTINLSGDGSQSNILNFIKLLENSRLIINIRELSDSRKSDQEEGGNAQNDFRFNILAEIYYYSLPVNI